jgi:predicted RNA-binding protein Jag
MRGVVCMLALALANAPAFAQTVERPKHSAPSPAEKSAKDIQDAKERAASWLKTCLEDWDAATHMTKKDWRTVCNRVTTERQNFLVANPEAFLMKNYEARPKVKN